MTEAVLDQFQKLFGKGFLIAAFVPSLLFVSFLKFLRVGWAQMQTNLNNLWASGWKLSLNVLAYLVIVYLLAYVLYGVRGLLHNLYQGRWDINVSTKQRYNEAIILPNWALKNVPLTRKPNFIVKGIHLLLNIPFTLGRRWEVSSFRKLKEISEVRVTVLDVPLWVRREFGGTFNQNRLTYEQAFPLIDNLNAKYEDFLKRFRSGDEWTETEYWQLLATAQLLRANRKRLEYLRTAIDLLVAEMKETHNAKGAKALRDAVDRLFNSADREWGSIYSHLNATFPDERWIRPTRLGNIAMVQETGPLHRYGINLSAIWPRLMHVLPVEARQRIEEANIYLDFTLIMSLLSFISGGVAIYSAFYSPSGRSKITTVLLIGACFIGFWSFYQLAIQATRGFGVEVQSAVDTYRLKLLDLLGLERPVDAENEKKIWTHLRYFISQGDLPTEGVRLTKSAQSEKEEKKTDE
ncbi:MAG TPA: hypothetical protein VGQ41_19370 [Pyrinomonadaceae bacterium]|jgi:hypothetical protein|nr:hypothetical protein [Pyrinomonadaceae bacterium]